MKRNPELQPLGPEALKKLSDFIPQAIASYQVGTNPDDPQGAYLDSIGLYQSPRDAAELSMRFVRMVVDPGSLGQAGGENLVLAAEVPELTRKFLSKLSVPQVQGLWLILNQAMQLSIMNDPDFNQSHQAAALEENSSRALRLWFFANELKSKGQLKEFDDPWSVVDSASRLDDLFADQFKDLVDLSQDEDLEKLLRIRTNINHTQVQLGTLIHVLDQVYHMESVDPMIDTPTQTSELAKGLAVIVATETAITSSSNPMPDEEVSIIRHLNEFDFRRYGRTVNWDVLIDVSNSLIAASIKGNYFDSCSLALDPQVADGLVKNNPKLAKADWNIIRILLREYGQRQINTFCLEASQRYDIDGEDLNRCFLYPPSLLAANVVRTIKQDSLIDQNDFNNFPYRNIN
jgi:hypothetical protein